MRTLFDSRSAEGACEHEQPQASVNPTISTNYRRKPLLKPGLIFCMPEKANGPETGPLRFHVLLTLLLLIGNAQVANTSRKIVRDRAHADDATGITQRRIFV